MLGDREKQLVKVLVALAWADGRVQAEEMEIVQAVLDGFGADAQSSAEIRDWANQPRTLDDVDLSKLEAEDAELMLYQAVVLSYIDGAQSAKEKALLEEFVGRLGMGREQANSVLAVATARAVELLPLLSA